MYNIVSSQLGSRRDNVILPALATRRLCASWPGSAAWATSSTTCAWRAPGSPYKKPVVRQIHPQPGWLPFPACVVMFVPATSLRRSRWFTGQPGLFQATSATLLSSGERVAVGRRTTLHVRFGRTFARLCDDLCPFITRLLKILKAPDLKAPDLAHIVVLRAHLPDANAVKILFALRHDRCRPCTGLS